MVDRRVSCSVIAVPRCIVIVRCSRNYYSAGFVGSARVLQRCRVADFAALDERPVCRPLVLYDSAADCGSLPFSSSEPQPSDLCYAYP